MADTFHQTETKLIRLEIRDEDNALKDPATSVKITISQGGGVVVDAVDMVHDSAGKYHYDFTPSSSHTVGCYEVSCTVIDGARKAVVEGELHIN